MLVSLRMINRAQECRQRAQHCERARSVAITLEARLMYFDLAQQWRESPDGRTLTLSRSVHARVALNSVVDGQV
jgi:hypothetical protein